MKKPKKDYCVGHISGQSAISAYNFKGWGWKTNPYITIHTVCGDIVRTYRIKLDEIVKMVKREDFKVIKKRVHKYLEVERGIE